MGNERRTGSGSSTTRWGTSGYRRRPSGEPRRSEPSRTSPSPDGLSNPSTSAPSRLIKAAAAHVERRTRSAWSRTWRRPSKTPRRQVADGRARCRVPDRHLPDRIRYIEQHERQRGRRHRWPPRLSTGRCIPTTRSMRASPATTTSQPRSMLRRPAALTRDLLPALDHLASALEAKAAEFHSVVKAGRTHLMDATPVTLGQEFGGYADPGPDRHGATGVHDAAPGRAAARGDRRGDGHQHTARIRFPRHRRSSPRTTGLPLTEARNHFEAQGSRDSLVETSGQLRTLAVGLHKICTDLRWMGSGRARGSGRSDCRICSRARASCRGRSTRSCPRRCPWSAPRSWATTPRSRSQAPQETSSSM